jgi:TPR repeat protein
MAVTIKSARRIDDAFLLLAQTHQSPDAYFTLAVESRSLVLTQLLQSSPEHLYRQALDLRQEKASEQAMQSAHRMFSIAALMGLYEARYYLGLMNMRGEGRERDRVRALMWFRLAGSRVDPRAARQAAELATDMKPVDIRRAMQSASRFDQAESVFAVARKGTDADAITRMGAMVMQGDGIDQDAVLAVAWLTWAAGKHHAEAQWRLGIAYAQGHGVSKNKAEASALLQSSVAQGNPDAQYHWARWIEQGSHDAESRAQALRLYESAAQQGQLAAQLHLAHALRAGETLRSPEAEGESSVPHRKTSHRSTAPHLVRSLQLFRMAAEQGHSEAQFELGQMYAQGLGAAQQFDEAARWYLLAAKQGHAKAQFHLGFLYSHGQGVEQDYATAYQWYSISEQCGYALARKNVAFIGGKLDKGEREMARWRAESFVFSVKEGAR